MKWLDKAGIWLMQHPVGAVAIFVLVMAVYIWLIYIEDKWGE